MHDVQWSPSGEHFITVAGFMPAKSTMFTEACKPFYDLGSGGHNLVSWNPQVSCPQILDSCSHADCVPRSDFSLHPPCHL